VVRQKLKLSLSNNQSHLESSSRPVVVRSYFATTKANARHALVTPLPLSASPYSLAVREYFRTTAARLRNEALRNAQKVVRMGPKRKRLMGEKPQFTKLIGVYERDSM